MIAEFSVVVLPRPEPHTVFYEDDSKCESCQGQQQLFPQFCPKVSIIVCIVRNFPIFIFLSLKKVETLGKYFIQVGAELGPSKLILELAKLKGFLIFSDGDLRFQYKELLYNLKLLTKPFKTPVGPKILLTAFYNGFDNQAGGEKPQPCLFYSLPISAQLAGFIVKLGSILDTQDTLGATD